MQAPPPHRTRNLGEEKRDSLTVVNPGPGSVRGGRHVALDKDGYFCPLQRVQHMVPPFPKAQAGRVHLRCAAGFGGPFS